MPIQSFTLDLTFKEMKYLLFSNKACPECGGRMEKSKRYEIVDGSMFNTNSVPLYIKGRKEVKRYFYVFTCTKCGSEFTLTELSK